MISNKAISDAFSTFLDRNLTSDEVALISSKCESQKDLLLLILIETDFIKRYPDVLEAIDNVSATVVRSGLDAYRIESKEYRIVNPLKQRLYQKQLEWARKSSRLIQLETDIAELKRQIASYQV